MDRVRSLPLLLSVLLLAPSPTGAGEPSARSHPSDLQPGARALVGTRPAVTPSVSRPASRARSIPHVPDAPPAPTIPTPGATTGSAWGGYLGSVESQVRRSLSRIHVRWEGTMAPGAPHEHAPGRDRGASGSAPREPSAGLGVPRELSLGQAIPNPSSRSVTLWLDLPEPSWVRFSILDVAGRMIEESSERRPAGRSSLVWPARSSSSAAAPGIYFARVTVNGRILPTRRWVLIP
jgi:hypothetical protein